MMVVDDLPINGWDKLSSGFSDLTAYHTTTWGKIVADSFGGTFRVLRVPSRGRHYVPILEGGTLARDGFVCGHIGYGGVFHEEHGMVLDLSTQLEVIQTVENALGLPCLRFVTTPTSTRLLHASSFSTSVLTLPLTAQQLSALYTSTVRNTIRKCERFGLEVRSVRPDEFDSCLELIHMTQVRVNAGYLTPRTLLQGIFAAPEEFSFIIGSYKDGRLVAVGVFLRAARKVVYYLNGWSQAAAAFAPNYMMLHGAFWACVEHGDISVDMGYSHSDTLLRSKIRWGATPAYFLKLKRECEGGLT